jgi:hypothetical protein
VKIFPIHGNIKEPEYDVQWFKQFDIILNALDNLGMSQCITSNLHRRCHQANCSQRLGDTSIKCVWLRTYHSWSPELLAILVRFNLYLRYGASFVTFPLMLHNLPTLCRILPNVSIVFLNLHQKPILYVRSGQHRVNQSTALYGVKVILWGKSALPSFQKISSRGTGNYLEMTRTRLAN